MKKYFFLILCSTAQTNTMDLNTQKVSNEWNAQLYAQGNRAQEETALIYLATSKIDLDKKHIIDIGSGTGNISKFMAGKAALVTGIDPSKSMVDWAKEQYKETQNLYFYQESAESLEPLRSTVKFDLATSFHCMHWVADKPKAFKKIYNVLQDNGDFLGTVITHADSQKSLNLQVFLEMIPGLQSTLTFLKYINAISSIGSSYPTDEEYKSMIIDAGFEIVSFKETSLSVPVKNREELAAMQKPILMSRPIMEWIPESLREYLFESFIDGMLKKLTLDTDNNYLFPMDATLVHARKSITK